MKASENLLCSQSTEKRPYKASSNANFGQPNGSQDGDNNAKGTEQPHEEERTRQCILSRLSSAERDRTSRLVGPAYEDAMMDAATELMTKGITQPKVSTVYARADVDTEEVADTEVTKQLKNFNDPDMPGRSSLKRKGPDSLARRDDNASLEFSRKRRRIDRERRLAFLIDVDRDSDTKMGGSPWQKAKGSLAFL
jgi:hypothetical protein